MHRNSMNGKRFTSIDRLSVRCYYTYFNLKKALDKCNNQIFGKLKSRSSSLILSHISRSSAATPCLQARIRRSLMSRKKMLFLRRNHYLNNDVQEYSSRLIDLANI